MRRAYHLHVLTVLKTGSLNLLEASGPVQACNGIAFALRTIWSPQSLTQYDVGKEDGTKIVLIKTKFSLQTFLILSAFTVRTVFDIGWSVCQYIWTAPTEVYDNGWADPVAARSKAWIFGRSLAGIAGSNLVRGMDMSLVSAVYCQVMVSASGWSLVQRSSIEFYSKASIMRMTWPIRGCFVMEKIILDKSVCKKTLW